MAAQPYASAAQSAPATYSAIPQQASANAAGASSGSAYAANANTAGANTGSAAGAGNGNNGVLSGTTYQSSGATSPLTPIQHGRFVFLFTSPEVQLTIYPIESVPCHPGSSNWYDLQEAYQML